MADSNMANSSEILEFDWRGAVIAQRLAAKFPAKTKAILNSVEGKKLTQEVEHAEKLHDQQKRDEMRQMVEEARQKEAAAAARPRRDSISRGANVQPRADQVVLEFDPEIEFNDAERKKIQKLLKISSAGIELGNKKLSDQALTKHAVTANEIMRKANAIQLHEMARACRRSRRTEKRQLPEGMGYLILQEHDEFPQRADGFGSHYGLIQNNALQHLEHRFNRSPPTTPRKNQTEYREGKDVEDWLVVPPERRNITPWPQHQNDSPEVEYSMSFMSGGAGTDEEATRASLAASVDESPYIPTRKQSSFASTTPTMTSGSNSSSSGTKRKASDQSADDSSPTPNRSTRARVKSARAKEAEMNGLHAQSRI